ncbi:MAG: hypothetical protein O3B73_02215 [bacterium]|nr:hypothetical protein [bacterium]
MDLCEGTLLLVFSLLLLIQRPGLAGAATLLVATEDSSQKAKAEADFLGDGLGDQEEINAAVQALPEPGGTVLLAEGTYDIRKAGDSLGGVIINRSHVTLRGQNSATKLILAPEQNTNVIRIIGSGVGHVAICDLWVDQNRDVNLYDGAEFVNISHGRFEYCGIKAFATKPGEPRVEPCHHVTIDNCTVLNARRLGIMLDGPYMRVLNNHLGNAMSDSVEILTGPGLITGNVVEITGRTHVAVGSDRGNAILMTHNIVHVKAGGDLDIAFRSWADSEQHVIANNIVTIDEGGRLNLAMDIRGFETAVSGNVVRGNDPENRLPLSLTGAGMMVSANHFRNVELVVNDQTGTERPIRIENNGMENSVITHRKNNLDT